MQKPFYVIAFSPLSQLDCSPAAALIYPVFPPLTQSTTSSPAHLYYARFLHVARRKAAALPPHAVIVVPLHL